MSKFIITFAGVPGSSKTPITNHLSNTFDLPVFNNDQVRFEVKEDLMIDNINMPKALALYDKRSKEMKNSILAKGNSVIFDSSVDRHWAELKQDCKKYGYKWFLINIDFSEALMEKLYRLTGRYKAVEQLPVYYKQHREFNTKYFKDVGLCLKDKDFKNRIKICLDTTARFIKDNS